jgi:plasmid replication initiation protein
MSSQEIIEARHQFVAQHNDFIRHPRNQLSPQELDIVYYLISKIKPSAANLMKISFTVQEFCKVTGIDPENGKNYRNVKNALKAVADKSALVDTSRGSKMLVRWIDTFEIWEKTGDMTATFSQSVAPYLLDLKELYTQAQLVNFLALKSKYSKRLYELLKSYLSAKNYRPVSKDFEITELKCILGAENYRRFKDFRVRVLEMSEKEINEVTDIKFHYTAKKSGRRTTHVSFWIENKKIDERLRALKSAEIALDGEDVHLPGQMDLEGNLVVFVGE